MAKRKKSAEEQPRELTRKEIHYNSRERERNQKLYIGVGLAIGLAVLVIVFGLLSQFVFKPNSALASVNGQTIVTKDFWKRARLQRSQLLSQLVQMQQLEQQFGGQGFFANQISQLQATLDSPFSLGVQVLDQMINEEVIAVEAAKRGITVTDAEVDELLREQIASQQGAVTESQATATSEAAIAATATADLWTPTPEAAIDVTSSITDTAEASPTPEPPAALPLLTDAEFQTGLSTLEGNIDQIAGITLVEYRDIVRSQLLSDKLAVVIADEEVTTTEEQVHARHILVRPFEPTPEPTPLPEGAEVTPTAEPTPLPEGAPTPTPTPEPRSDEEAKALADEIYNRLQEGEDFTALAAVYSDDPSNSDLGGDLGWFGRNVMVDAFEEAAFGLAVGEISQPVETQFGYHIIEVVERDDARPKDESTLEGERQQAFRDWLTAQIVATDIERPDDLASKLPSDLIVRQPVIVNPDAAPVAPQQ